MDHLHENETTGFRPDDLERNELVDELVAEEEELEASMGPVPDYVKP